MSAPCPWPRQPRRPFPWGAVLILAGAICLGYGIGRASASERPWIVWSLDADAPWTSPRGHQATATGPTACSLALHEASQVSPKGARLACRKIDRRK